MQLRYCFQCCTYEGMCSTAQIGSYTETAPLYLGVPSFVKRPNNDLRLQCYDAGTKLFVFSPSGFGHLNEELFGHVLQDHFLLSAILESLLIHRMQLPAVELASTVLEKFFVEMLVHGTRKTHWHASYQRQKSHNTIGFLVMKCQPSFFIFKVLFVSDTG